MELKILTKPTVPFQTLISSLIFGFVCLFSCLTWSAPQSFLERESYLVTAGSQTQKYIDDAVESIFNSAIQNDLCHVYGNAPALTYSVGVSYDRAQKIIQSCPPKSIHNFIPKLSPKKYFLIFDDQPHSEIESWTTDQNFTYIWIHPQMSFDDFKTVIMHEIAISVDGKMGMMLTTYFKYQNLYSTQLPNNTLLITMPSQLSALEERMRKSFNGAFYHPIAYSLALMRAYHFEKLVKGEISHRAIPSHQVCVAEFVSLYQKILNQPEEFKYNRKSIQGTLVDVIEKNISQQLIEETILAIGDSGFILPGDGDLTFCQYMARPLLSGRSVDSFYAQGPRRPRTGSGWRPGPGEPGTTDGNGETTKFSPTGGESRFQTKSIQSHILVQEIKQDLIQNRLKKFEKAGIR